MKQTAQPADAMRSIIERATSDPVFRTSLKENPRLTLEAELTRLAGSEVRLPDGLDVAVVEDTATRMHLVLPLAAPAGQELTEGDLEQLSGGTMTYTSGNCRTLKKPAGWC